MTHSSLGRFVCVQNVICYYYCVNMCLTVYALYHRNIAQKQREQQNALSPVKTSLYNPDEDNHHTHAAMQHNRYIGAVNTLKFLVECKKALNDTNKGGASVRIMFEDKLIETQSASSNSNSQSVLQSTRMDLENINPSSSTEV